MGLQLPCTGGTMLLGLALAFLLSRGKEAVAVLLTAA